MGEGTNPRGKLHFDRRIRLEFHGVPITSDAGLLACRERDDALGLTETASECPPLTTGTCGLANPRHNNTECPQLARGLYGRMCSRPGSGDCPFGLSLVSWVSTGTPPASTPWPIARH